MSERLRQQRPQISEAFAIRAVGICEGCPMAALCANKPVPPCETDGAQYEPTGGGGDYAAPLPDKLQRRSYRNELLNDAIPIVMADLRKNKEPKLPPKIPSKPTMAPKLPPTQPPRPRVTPPARVQSPEHRQGGGAGIVADILVSMFGIQSIATSSAKKKV